MTGSSAAPRRDRVTRLLAYETEPRLAQQQLTERTSPCAVNDAKGALHVIFASGRFACGAGAIVQRAHTRTTGVDDMFTVRPHWQWGFVSASLSRAVRIYSPGSGLSNALPCAMSPKTRLMTSESVPQSAMVKPGTPTSGGETQQVNAASP